LNFSVDLDLVANDHTAGFGDCAPGKTKFFTADLAADRETGLCLPVGVFYDAAILYIQGDRFGYAFDSEVTI